MERLQIRLYVGMPVFGILLAIIPWVVPIEQEIRDMLFWANPVPIALLLLMIVIDDGWRDGIFSFPVFGIGLIIIGFVGANVAVWLPVGHGIYKLTRRLQRRRDMLRDRRPVR